MKRTISLLLTISLILTLAGCIKAPFASTSGSTDTTESPTPGETDLPDGTCTPSQTTVAATTQTPTTVPPTTGTPTTVPPTTETPTTVTPTTETPTTVAPTTTATPTTVKPSTATKPQEDQQQQQTSSKNNLLVRVADYIPDIVVELRYASENNYTGKAVYDFQDAYLRYGTVQKLLKVQEQLRKQGYSLKIWDAFRPIGAQYILWEAHPDETYVNNPDKDPSAHTQGDTVDVTLVDAQGNELDMPSDYDVFSTQGDRDYTDCTPEQKSNALILQNAMKNAGFSAYYAEWWHFSDKDSYSDNTAFDPAVVSVWYANCTNYITFRKTPYVNGKEIGKIKAGETVILMGWHEKFAFVEYNGVQGYVLSEYLAPESQWDPGDLLTVVKITDTYTYEQMQLDIATLAATYPDLLQVGSIGTSELGRDLTLLKVGDPNASRHVLIQAAIHAREHMTTWTVMAMVDYWLSHGMAGCEDVCFHIIPMLNPDGVTLSQTGNMTEEQLSIYNSDIKKGNTNATQQDYAATWKANGLGVDLNRNFDAAWDITGSRSDPSSERYKGETPFSAAEAIALRDYTLTLQPDVTISYHSTGSVIYYEYGSKEVVNRESASLGHAVAGVTGYRMDGQTGLDAAGYKDWCMDVLEIPSLTIEIGCTFCPLPRREVYSLFLRNLRVLPTIAQWTLTHT